MRGARRGRRRLFGNRAVTLAASAASGKTVTCLDAPTGKQLWAYGYAALFEGSYSGDAPALNAHDCRRPRLHPRRNRPWPPALRWIPALWSRQRDLYKDAKGGRLNLGTLARRSCSMAK